MKIIGLCGYAGSGKDAVGKILVTAHGYQRIAFADAVKREALEKHGWSGRKDDEGRRLLQRIGMEGRAKDPDCWVRLALRQIHHFHVVFTDVRFPNEVAALRQLGGVLVRVTRPGCGPVNEHISETALDAIAPQFLIENSGTLDDLAAQVVILLAAMRGECRGQR